ncbi:MAG: glycoside hydrolase [Candidatus Omnitrophota bacterium]
MNVFLKKHYLQTLSIFLIFAFFLSMTPADVYSQMGLLAPQKGMCYVTWDKDRFASQYSDESLKKLSSMGVEYISVCLTQYQDRFDSTEIKATKRTPSKKSVKHVINTIHSLGMRTMLKPHIDLIDKGDGTYWRADIGSASEKGWAEWFSEYRKFILSYARMAEKMNVEIFCVGTELSFASQRLSEWKEIISEIRKIYSGKLVYAANWDNFKNIGFWEDLDYVGIDAYFPLSYVSDPSLEDLKNGWKKWKYDIETWQTEIGKPVLFTEIGYASTPEAPYFPWKSGSYGNADANIQALCYKAFFETIWNEPWFAGVYWWKWDTNVNAGGKYNRQFTPQNKPAQEILAANYKGLSESNVYAMVD